MICFTPPPPAVEDEVCKLVTRAQSSPDNLSMITEAGCMLESGNMDLIINFVNIQQWCKHLLGFKGRQEHHLASKACLNPSLRDHILVLLLPPLGADGLQVEAALHQLFSVPETKHQGFALSR